MSRVRKRQSQTACLHAGMDMTFYDEQREREMQSISSLLMSGMKMNMEEERMLHPSYADLIKVVNSNVEEGEDPVVSSRYSIVMATSKRARQIIAGDDELVDGKGKKPLSVAVEELNQGKIQILNDETTEEAEQAPAGEQTL